METKKKKSEKANKQNGTPEQKPKSDLTLFREKYPNGYAGGCEIINMRAVLK